VLDDINQPVKDAGQITAQFSRSDHRAIQGGKYAGKLLQRFGKGRAPPDIHNDFSYRVFQHAALRLRFQHLQEPEYRHARAEHGTKLLRKEYQVRNFDATGKKRHPGFHPRGPVSYLFGNQTACHQYIGRLLHGGRLDLPRNFIPALV